MRKFNENLTILVTSCDKYSDLWQPFIKLFRKFWPDCPYKVVLISETVTCNDFDQTVLCGTGRTSTETICIALQQLTTPYVLLLCDDYFLIDYVNTENIKKILCDIEKYHSGCIKMLGDNTVLQSKILQTKPVNIENGEYIEYPKGSPYRLSFQSSIWNRTFLYELMSRAENIWDFERKISYDKISYTMPIYGTRKRTFPYIEVVHKGKWEHLALQICNYNDIPIDLTKRGVLSSWDQLKRYIRGWILEINPNMIIKLQNILSHEKRK